MKCENRKEEKENTEIDEVREFVKSRRKNLRQISLRDIAVELIALVKELEERVKKLEAKIK